MKSYLLLFMLVITSYSIQSQSLFEVQLSNRDSIIRLFHSHHDTITINTWLNIRRSNQYLKQIVETDSALIHSLLQELESTGTDENSTINTIELLNTELDSLYASIDKPIKLERSKPLIKYYTYIFIGLLLIVVLLLIFLKLFADKLTKRDIIIKQYHTDLYAAKLEIEKMDKTHDVLATEINSLKKEIARVENNKKLLQQLEDDKLLLEQQILEFRKAYFAETEKHKEVEASLRQLNNDKNTEIQKLKADIKILKGGITAAESFQNKLVKEFNTLIDKIQKRF